MTAAILDRIANLADRAIAELGPDLTVEARVLEAARRLDEADRWLASARSDGTHREDLALGRVQAYIANATEAIGVLTFTTSRLPGSSSPQETGGTGRPAETVREVWVPSDTAPTGGQVPRSEPSTPNPNPDERRD